MSHNDMQSLYWQLRDAGNGFGSVKSDALRARLEHWNGVQRHMDKVHAMTRQSDELILEIATWFIPVGAITKVRYLKYAERLFNFKRGRIFWSGGAEAGGTANSYAKLFGGHTLEMTLKGKYIKILQRIKGFDAVKPLWEKASADFATGAKGEVNVFLNSARVQSKSVWNKIEKPILEVKNIIIEHKW